MTNQSKQQPASTRGSQRQETAHRAAEAARAAQKRRALRTKVVAGTAAAAVLGGLFLVYDDAAEEVSGSSANLDYAVGSPGPGEQAIDFTLTSTEGEDVSLSDFRGQDVLLYVHEGVGCQPCFDQIRDLEKQAAKLEAAGIDQLVTITSAPRDVLAQKMDDDALASVALADPGLDMISSYEANKYGMMGDSRAGHSFLLIDGDGEIVWRADYGGAPDYTMYLPVEQVLADLEGGRTDA